ncbi:hypothetical protein [Roseitalea porphyridii]|uniref:Uncharacterized protein n=1 Tax=Roseitalea porphyridii TaxID=1852022 RepID=A0A4P6V128_9HYPH|nr:hypothetical protein [Roseitalea porphyridii]QBK31042.1 hypothetical protein E0E05_10830 [Roseitalea porphyridii]
MSGPGYGNVPPEDDQGIFEPPAARPGGDRGTPTRRTFVGGLLALRRGPWEMVATVLIALGVFMLMQPFVIWAFTYSFIVTLTGTVMFLIVSHFPE